MDLVTLAEIRTAARRIAGTARHTPLLPCPWAADGPLLVKPENLQPVGAFKVRGATNRVAALTPAERARGVITHSSGNHGAALAYAARAQGVPALVVLVDTTPQVKVDAVRALGAEIVFTDPANRQADAERLAAERSMVLVPPFDDRYVIAGQGTIGLEILADAPDVAQVLVPVGGGGMAAGVAAVVKTLCPSVRVVGVEPELAADARDSLRAGRRVQLPVEQRYRTVADGARTELSELTWAHLRRYLDDIVVVSDGQLLDTVRTLALAARLVVEPTGALATAAFLHHPELRTVGPTVAVISGGNIDPQLLAEVLTK